MVGERSVISAEKPICLERSCHEHRAPLLCSSIVYISGIPTLTIHKYVVKKPVNLLYSTCPAQIRDRSDLHNVFLAQDAKYHAALERTLGLLDGLVTIAAFGPNDHYTTSVVKVKRGWSWAKEQGIRYRVNTLGRIKLDNSQRLRRLPSTLFTVVGLSPPSHMSC